MYISGKLVFVELHKTGGSHILNLLDKLLEGKRQGKHIRVPDYLQNRFIVGSVRDPWDWHVSLWAYGCSGRGVFFEQVTRKFYLPYYFRALPSEMGSKVLTPRELGIHLRADLYKPVTTWKSYYKNSDDAVAFRKWLKDLYDSDRRYDMGEGYGLSPLSDQYGLMTYRYFKLFTSLQREIYNGELLQKHESLEDIWQKYKITDYIVRNENLEEELIKAIELSGHKISEADKNMIMDARQSKSNTSSRGNTSEYYDEETYDLIRKREKFIICQHGYSA